MLVQNVLAVALVQAEAQPGAAGRTAGLPDVAGQDGTATSGEHDRYGDVLSRRQLLGLSDAHAALALITARH
jgi:hypothetical protein